MTCQKEISQGKYVSTYCQLENGHEGKCQIVGVRHGWPVASVLPPKQNPILPRQPGEWEKKLPFAPNPREEQKSDNLQDSGRRDVALDAPASPDRLPPISDSLSATRATVRARAQLASADLAIEPRTPSNERRVPGYDRRKNWSNFLTSTVIRSSPEFNRRRADRRRFAPLP